MLIFKRNYLKVDLKNILTFYASENNKLVKLVLEKFLILIIIFCFTEGSFALHFSKYSNPDKLIA